MKNLEEYCTSDLLDEKILVIAKKVLQIATDYANEKNKEKNLSYILKLMNVPPMMKQVYKIIDRAYGEFIQDLQNGNVTKEDRDNIISQAEAYNKIIEDANKQKKQSGVKSRSFNKIKLVQKSKVDVEEESEIL